uniref:Uncharacterized protein n=1 Tax=Timema cristinae TaxID=61476 RepID=A0A7R9CTZ2_TIMCR|nr:unnamed protein product [Timema cristinae]
MMQGIGDPTGIPNSKTDTTPTTMEGTAPITVLISDYPNTSLEVRPSPHDSQNDNLYPKSCGVIVVMGEEGLWHRYPGRVAGLANARINHCVSERILERSSELFGEAYGSQEEKKLEDELDRLRSYRDTLAGGTLDWREASTCLQGAVELLDRAVQVCKQLASQCWDLFLAPMMDSLSEECSVLRGKRTTKLPVGSINFLVHFTLVQSECRVALLTHWISLDPLASLGFQVPASLAGFYCEQIRITSGQDDRLDKLRDTLVYEQQLHFGDVFYLRVSKQREMV